jgi:hypothetical protein
LKSCHSDFMPMESQSSLNGFEGKAGDFKYVSEGASICEERPTLFSYAANMRYSRSRQLWTSVVLTAVYLCCSATATATCYLPDGSPAYGDIPCSGSLPSMCCPADGICLSNGLCFSTANIVARSSCTDQTWDSDVCTNICKTSKGPPSLASVFCD